MSKQLLILNYHDIHTGDHPGNRYSVHIDTFRSHLDLLQSRSINVIGISSFLDDDVSEGLHVAITFDDGFLSQFEHAVPELIRYHFPATFFIVSNYRGSQFMQKEHISELSALGFEIGSHGVTHTSFTQLDTASLKAEVRQSMQELVGITGRQTMFLSLPFSRYNALVLDTLRGSGLKAVFSTNTRINHFNDEVFLIHRINVKSSTARARIEGMLDKNKVSQFRYQLKNALLTAIRNFCGGVLLRGQDERQHIEFNTPG